MASRVAAAVRHSPALAAALSFLWPGLGQGWAGARRRALLFAVPMMLLLAAVLLVLMVQGRARAFGLLVQPSVLLALLALNVAVLGYRLVAIVDAYRVAHRRWPAPPARGQAAITAVLLGVLLGGTLLMHGWLGLVAYKTYDTFGAISHPFSTPTPVATPTLAPGETPGPTPIPTPIPTPEPAWGDNGRMDLLLIGGDAGPGRFSLRTDTMILLSVEIATGRAAMFGIPRNMLNVPLPDGPADAFQCRCLPEFLNGLFVYAMAHPESFPGADEERGYMAVQGAIGKLTGLQIDGQVVVTLEGFIRIVDALGGLEMTTRDSVYDSTYPDPLSTHNVVISIPRGFHHFDGWHALAYARSRHQDNDYNRMDRQQEVLRALRAQLDPCTLIPRIPQLLDIAKTSLWTNIPIERLPDLFEIGARIEVGSIARFQFWPPDIHESLDIESINRIRLMVRTAFAGPLPTRDPSASPTPEPGSGSIC
ncbi:MAG: LCP family protein [Chloroflexota bacterium]|nr:LCP family protein [Chloroflexota bacterium]